MMVDNKDSLIKNFDTIAAYSKDQWNHNNHYHGILLKYLPGSRNNALDIGCGLGEFTRSLSLEFKNVTGVDFSPVMISKAVAQSKSFKKINYVLKDFMEMDDNTFLNTTIGPQRMLRPVHRFDCIVSIACFHHLPILESLLKMKSLLNKNGRIIILDLYKEKTIGDYATLAIAAILNKFYVIKNKGIKTEKEFNEAWKDHDKFEKYLTLKEIKKMSKTVFSKVKLKRLLFWRYILILEH